MDFRCSACCERKPREMFRVGRRLVYDKGPEGSRWIDSVWSRCRACVDQCAKRDRPKLIAHRAVAHEIRHKRMLKAAQVACEDGPDGCSRTNYWHHDSYFPEDYLAVRCLCGAHHSAWHASNEAKLPIEVQ